MKSFKQHLAESSTDLGEAVGNDGKSSALSDLWKLDGEEGEAAIDTVWKKIFGTANEQAKGISYRKMKGHLSGLKSGDKVSASIKKSILTDLGHDESFVKTIGKSNLKLQKSIMKNKVVIDTASANRAGHISDHIKSHASNEVEEIAMTRFYQKYGSDMDVYDIRHTYPDFKAVERSGKETISATNRTSTTSTEYIGKVSGGGHTMEWTLDDPLTSYSSRRI